MITRTEVYEDRGLNRTRIEWEDGSRKGIADTHCAVTGEPLCETLDECVKHCRVFGHYSRDLDRMIRYYVDEEITKGTLDGWIKTQNRYPQSPL